MPKRKVTKEKGTTNAAHPCLPQAGPRAIRFAITLASICATPFVDVHALKHYRLFVVIELV